MSNITVCARFRPLSSKERTNHGDFVCLHKIDTETFVFKDEKEEDFSFSLDRVFYEESKQVEVFEFLDQKQMKKPVSWDDLPMDILRTIMEKPFLSKDCHCVWSARLGMNHLLGAYARASRHGWVLFSQILCFDEYPAENTYYDQYFLYNPFTNEVIKFPKLMMEFNRRDTFTKRRGSPSCMIISFSKQSWKLYLETGNLGDKSWKIYEDVCRCYIVLDVACVGNFVYCVFQHGKPEQLGIFNIKPHKWKVFSGFFPKNVGFHGLVVAFNGVLLLPTESKNKWRLKFWTFDLAKEKWVIVADEWMTKQMIFYVAHHHLRFRQWEMQHNLQGRYIFSVHTRSISCVTLSTLLHLSGIHNIING